MVFFGTPACVCEEAVYEAAELFVGVVVFAGGDVVFGELEAGEGVGEAD